METEQREQELERQRWLEQRRTGIGGSDAAAIIGLSRWSGPIDVWAEKMGVAPARPDNEAMWWGRELEALIRRRYTESTGRQVARPEGMYRHPQHDCLLANVDGLVLGQREPCGLEIKTANVRLADEWGEDGTDAIPTHYVIQCCHYMLVTGYRRWDVATLIGGSDFRVYHLHADPELEVFLLEKELAFWNDFVKTGVEPPIDASDGYRDYLHRKFPMERGRTLAPAPAEANEWAHRLEHARDFLRSVGEDAQLAENSLKALLGDAPGFEGDGWRVTWKKDRDRDVVDWRSYAQALEGLVYRIGPETMVRMLKPGYETATKELLAATITDYEKTTKQGLEQIKQGLEQIMQASTETRPGPRRFIFKDTSISTEAAA